MAEITLKSGKVVKIDVSELTTKEWRAFASPKSTTDDENAVLLKCTNLSLDDIENMPYRALKSVVKAIIIAAQDPLLDPN